MTENFADLFEASTKSLRNGFDIGEKIEATIISIGKRTIFIDVNATSEGFIDIDQFLGKDGEVTVKVGDKINVYFVSAKNGYEFTTKMSSESAASHLDEIYASGIPVEGKVIAERNGGYTVKVGGQEAFCPFSQIDMRRGEPEMYIGQTFNFKITELKGHNVVVSRRQILETEAAEQLQDLQHNLVEGDIITGTVSRIMDFGAFVEVGGGIDGLIPISELAWWRVEDVNECVKVGETVDVKIIKLDWVNDRITLSLKQAGRSPWEEVADKFTIGEKRTGVVTRLAPFGAFVELEKGIDGLVHISKLGAGRRINHPKEVVEEGQEVEFYIENIDLENQRISLSMEESYGQTQQPTETVAKVSIEPVREGEVIVGKIESIREFGVFIKLNPEQTGLLHVSKADIGSAPNSHRALSKKFTIGSTVEVIVDEINGDRISLSLKELADLAKAEADTPKNFTDKAEGFGSLGGMFDNLSL